VDKEKRTGWGFVPEEVIPDDQFLFLNYVNKKFNNQEDLKKWKTDYSWNNNNNWNGELCDMSQPQPTWNQTVIDWASKELQIKDIGTSYFRLTPGSCLPLHRDTYATYKELFDCKINDIIRCVVFLQEWRPGHFLQVETKNGAPRHYEIVANYPRLKYFWWRGDTEHSAANIGDTSRYTLQITGHE